MAEILRYLIILLGGCRGNPIPFQKGLLPEHIQGQIWGEGMGAGQTQKKPSVNSHV
jgi:hypothetical protein